jgi:hypothetical protein
MIKFLGLLPLDFLIHFGGCQPSDFVAYVFNLRPSKIFGRTFRAILLLADELRQFIQFCYYCWRPLVPTSFDFRCHDLSFLDGVN